MELSFFTDTARSSAERLKRMASSVSSSSPSPLSSAPASVPTQELSANFLAYGSDYYDNPDLGYGYGGYYYDGRYAPVAKQIAQHYQLSPHSKILEIGCAKGFLLVEFRRLNIQAYGLEYSQYAIKQAHDEVRDSIVMGSAANLPYDDNDFDFVICKEVLPHLSEDGVVQGVKEISRVTKEKSFILVQCVESEQAKQLTQQWDQTHQTLRRRSWWETLFDQQQYRGDYAFKELF